MKYYSFPILLISLTFFFLPVLNAARSNLIHDSCEKAANSNPNLSYEFCVACVESNPRTQNATSLKELAMVTIDLIISNAKNISSHITQLISTSKSLDEHIKICLHDCLELYTDANSTLQEAMNDFESIDYEGATVKMSSAMHASTTCEDGFKEKKGEVSPLTTENNVFFQFTVISLTFINMLFQY